MGLEDVKVLSLHWEGQDACAQFDTDYYKLVWASQRGLVGNVEGVKNVHLYSGRDPVVGIFSRPDGLCYCVDNQKEISQQVVGALWSKAQQALDDVFLDVQENRSLTRSAHQLLRMREVLYVGADIHKALLANSITKVHDIPFRIGTNDEYLVAPSSQYPLTLRE